MALFRTDQGYALSPSHGVAFVAPLPPPVNGFSSISAAMCDLLQARAPVLILNRARGADSPDRGLMRQLLKPLRYLGSGPRAEGALYLALSGGMGQLLDLPYILIGRLARQRICIHHHSFAYINAPTALSRIIFALLKQQSHIVLSAGMGAALIERYGLRSERVIVLSNAAFFGPLVPAATLAADAAADPVRIGYLSNITFDKGFVEFFDVLDALSRCGVAHRAFLAGPLAADARASFERRLANASQATYVGPLYGDDKERFYRQLNVLLFPSKYANEAEPLVVHEALRSGVYVIATDRGAIGDILANGAGLTLPLQDFVSQAAERIGRLSRQRDQLVNGQRLAYLQAQRLYSSSVESLADALAHIVDGRRAPRSP